MRTIITILLGMLMVLAGATLYTGCNREGETLVVDSPQVNEFTLDPGDSDPSNTPLKARIIGADPDHAQRAVVLTLQIVEPDGSEVQRSFRMQVDEDSVGNVFLASSLSDTSGPILWSLRYTLDNQDSTHVLSAMSTPSHDVALDQRESNGFRYETYSYDGSTHVFSLPVSDLSRAVQLYGEGLVDGRFSRSNLPERLPTDKEIIRQIESFQRYSIAHGSFALDANSDLGARLSKNPQVIERVRAELGLPDGDPVTENFWKKLCVTAGACSAIACMVGPNPICNGCGTVAAVCAVVSFGMMLYDAAFAE